MSEVRLLVVGPDPLARAGLALLLADQPGVSVAGQVSGEALPADLEIYRPEIIVWDLGWEPDESLSHLSDALAESEGDMKPIEDSLAVVALLPDEEPAAAAWALGVRGLLLRQAPVERLLAAIAAVAQGLRVIEPELASGWQPAAAVPEPPLAEPLTPRELEVLQLLAEGLGNKAIARRLGISEHTVKFHLNALMGKLGAQSRTAAVVRATRLGLVVL